MELKKTFEILKCKIVDIEPITEVPPGMKVTIRGDELVVSMRELELMAWAVEMRQKLQPTNYEEYLKSLEWNIRKKIALQNAKHRCQLCNKNHNLNVHHKTYDNIYNETLEDLIVLCSVCHEKFHEIT